MHGPTLAHPYLNDHADGLRTNMGVVRASIGGGLCPAQAVGVSEAYALSGRANLSGLKLRAIKVGRPRADRQHVMRATCV